uniref:receptor-like protein EIX1 n=1 Tax=Erigeron canadensis TaxID=72917 RepID=UPI001CB8A5E9|nr:receptor-like protein EIX1 [Erigeron canadensis]
MKTTCLVILILLIQSFQTYGASSSNTMMRASSNVTCFQRERQSLLVFRQGLTDKSNRLSTWTGVECCEWEGVGCDKKNGHIVKIDLRSPLSFLDDYTINTSNWLEGKVSSSLLNLKHLSYLDLSMNNFLGQTIPEFIGSFKYLEYLNLSYSGFSGVVPPHLGNLSMLQYLDLNYLDRYDMVSSSYDVSLMVKDDMWWVSLLLSLKHLDFSGVTIGNHIDWFHPVNMLPSLLTLNLASCNINIPSKRFSNFTSLKSLDLYGNNISSTIPLWLSNLTTLVHVNLRKNNFHGRIPDSIGTISSLSSIDLSSNQLSGRIPPSLGGLSSLRALYLDNNRLNESIPKSIGLLTKLQELYLDNNHLSGNTPTSLGELSYLQYLYLSRNQLSGSIPESIGLLTMLQELYLDNNQLSGNVPTSIGQLSNLQYLYFDCNKLSGNIPKNIGLLTKLQVLDLSYNQLSGSIPESIGLLTRLRELYLCENQLSGNNPTSIGQLSNLEYLYLDSNQLSGIISENHFTKLNKLTILWLCYNSLTLNVSPHWISPFQLIDFNASSCNIGPQFPNWLQTSTNLQGLDLSNSGIKDSIPEWFENISSHIRVLDLSDNQIGGNLPKLINQHSWKSMDSGLLYLNLRKNYFTGSVPTHLCELLNTQLLDLSDNNFSGVLPNCLGNLIQLRVMDLTNNTITGIVPTSLGSLSHLKSLHLHNNKFGGDLPATLQNLTNLVTFDLGNNLLTGIIPSWIGKKLSKLKILNLQSNNFMGRIPPELCQNNYLQHLNLADNSITGMIPRCFYNLTGMIWTNVNFEYNGTGYEENIEVYIKGLQLKYTKTVKFLISLDLSSNQIFGKIPGVLMNLVALKNLNLSRNLLSGHIPSTIGNLKQIESLDLSANKLSGRIPPSLASLNFLSCLNVSFNNLSGPIPTGNQLQTLGDPLTIYEGNTDLCGPSLSRSCKETNLPYVHARKDEGGDALQGCSWFYFGMVPGFVVGFVGLIGSLYFIRTWRVTYFKIIENFYAFQKISMIVTLARLRWKIFR